MSDSIVTTDFSDFGYRELAMTAELLTALSEGKCPDDFEYDKIKVCMNRYSGNVFLTNDCCQVAMMNGEVLESFYSSPYEGKEGFWEELIEEYEGMHPEDQRWMKDIANGRGLPDPEGEDEEDGDDER
jgi:hypothetical protein